MSDIKIKTYKKGVEEEQAKVGVEATKDWLEFNQSSAEALKQYYSQDDFDPETRFYAYKDDKLIGFMVSKILPDDEDGIKRAQHDFPYVIEQKDEVSKLLYDHALKVLKKKGVKILEARAGKAWGNTAEQAKKLGYKKGRVLFLKTETKLEDLKYNKETDVEFRNFDPEEDKDAIIQLFIDQFNMTNEQATANFEGIIKSEGGKYYQPIIKKNDKIISRGLVFIPDDNSAAIFRPLVPEPQKYFDAYLKKAVEFAKKNGAKSFAVYFGGQAIDQIDFYEKHGLKIAYKIHIFEKEL